MCDDALLFTKQYNLVPIKRRWHSAAGEVTIGLASQWPCVTDSVIYPPTANGWEMTSRLSPSAYGPFIFCLNKTRRLRRCFTWRVRGSAAWWRHSTAARWRHSGCSLRWVCRHEDTQVWRRLSTCGGRWGHRRRSDAGWCSEHHGSQWQVDTTQHGASQRWRLRLTRTERRRLSSQHVQQRPTAGGRLQRRRAGRRRL